MREQSCGIFDLFGAIYDFRLRRLKNWPVRRWWNPFLIDYFVFDWFEISRNYQLSLDEEV